jgi:anaerobic selenocysteine-containing dehydrogenase
LAFVSGLLHSRPSPDEGVRALRKLDFYVHCDSFLTPMATEADVVLPVSSAWEREGIADGFRVSQEADALLQLRKAVVPPRGETRSDSWIAFELAKRLRSRGPVLRRRHRRRYRTYAGTVAPDAGNAAGASGRHRAPALDAVGKILTAWLCDTNRPR